MLKVCLVLKLLRLLTWISVSTPNFSRGELGVGEELEPPFLLGMFWFCVQETCDEVLIPWIFCTKTIKGNKEG